MNKAEPLPPFKKISIIDEAKNNYGAHLLSINPGGVDETVFQSSCFYYEAELLPLIPDNKSLSILDVGSGLGHLLRYLLANGYQNIGGIEIDLQLYNESKKYIGEKIKFLINDDALHYLSNNIEIFDVISLFDVIEHFSLEDAYDLLCKIHDSLRPDGIAIFRTPNMANILGAYSRYMDITHQSGFTEQSLTQLIRQAGYSQIKVHIPKWNKNNPLSVKFKESSDFQKKIYQMQDRAMPTTFDKNLVIWAKK